MAEGRRSKILEMLEEDGVVKTNELVSLFGVSRESVRRDLEILENEGKINRIHGGAVSRKRFGVEPDFNDREMKNRAEKMEIGRAAADLIKDGETIAVDAGATTLAFAKELAGRRKDITIITNNLLIGGLLAGKPDFRVILLGGDVKQDGFSTQGFLGEENMKLFNVDKYISGVCGITPEGGISNYHIEESSLQRRMMKQAPYVIALADHSKLGNTCLNHVCDIRDINVLVTDSKADRRMLQKIRDMGVEIVISGA